MEFSLNAERCVRCGLCVAECPTGYLVMTEEGPKPNRGGCLQCG
ncbi:MAG: 4Fe-4S binding protein, partial [Veillonella sp.]|nr:4Fe-4S binding protein [Veillonella sp.]